MSGADKDHKETKDNLKMRPIVNAMDGPKKTISDIFSDVITAVAESNSDGILCSSTEELLEAFEAYNNTVNNNAEDGEKRIIGSMDAVALCSSLDAKKSAEIIKEVIRSEIIFENVDLHELGIYPRKNLGHKYIIGNGFDDILPKKEKKSHRTKDKEDREDKDNMYDYVESLEYLFLEEDKITMYDVDCQDKNLEDKMVEEKLFHEEEDMIMFEENVPDDELEDISVENVPDDELEDINVENVPDNELEDISVEEDLFHEEEDVDIDIVMFEENIPDKELDDSIVVVDIDSCLTKAARPGNSEKSDSLDFDTSSNEGEAERDEKREDVPEEKDKYATDASKQRERNGICDEYSATNTSERVRKAQNICGKEKATNKEKENKSYWKES